MNDILVQDEKKRHLSEKEVEKVKKTNGKPNKQTKVKQQMLNDLAIFQQVMKHPQYAKDPFQTISTHVENKMLLEAGMQSLKINHTILITSTFLNWRIFFTFKKNVIFFPDEYKRRV